MEPIIWREDYDWDPLYRMAHVAFPYGRYIVIMNGYANTDDPQPKTYEFDLSRITFYDILEKKHHVVPCEIDNESCEKFGIEPNALASSGCAMAWDNSLVFMFAGFSIFCRRSTNYLSYIDFKVNPLMAKIISGGFGSEDNPVPTCRDKCSMNFWENSLYVFGGYGDRPNDTNQEFLSHYLDGNGAFIVNVGDLDERSWNNQLLVYDLDTHTWSCPTNYGHIPSPRAAHATCLIQDTLYLFGGRSHSFSGVNRLNDLYSLSLPHLQWTLISLKGNIPCGRSWITLNPLSSDCLLIIGGLDVHNQPLDDAYAVTMNEEYRVTRVYPNSCRFPGGARLWHSSTTAFDNCVYSIGGCCSDLFSDRAKVQTQIDRYHVMRPMSLFKQSLLVAAKYQIRDPFLPAILVSKLEALSGG